MDHSEDRPYYRLCRTDFDSEPILACDKLYAMKVILSPPYDAHMYMYHTLVVEGQVVCNNIFILVVTEQVHEYNYYCDLHACMAYYQESMGS